MARKSFELYAQVAAWTGGIAAAAAGGVLLALVSPETPASIIRILRALGFALIIAVVACGYMQYHAIGVVNAHEREAKEDIESSRKYLGWSQRAMIVAFAVALLALAVGLLMFKPNSPGSKAWSVVGTSSSERESLVVMGRAGSSTIRTLTRIAGRDGWTVCEVSAEKIGQAGRGCGVAVPDNQPAQAGLRPILQRMDASIVFDPGKSTLKYEYAERDVDLEDQVCKAKQGLRNASAGGVIVVGRHDMQHLTGSATRELGSNQTLAQRRAEAVAFYLASDSKCGRAVGPVISVAVAPVIIPTGRPTPEALAADRSVDVFGLTTD